MGGRFRCVSLSVNNQSVDVGCWSRRWSGDWFGRHSNLTREVHGLVCEGLVSVRDAAIKTRNFARGPVIICVVNALVWLAMVGNLVFDSFLLERFYWVLKIASCKANHLNVW